jgi:hypothetical protein
MLRFKIKEDRYWSSIKTLLLYLDYITQDFKPELPIDDVIAQRLREL